MVRYAPLAGLVLASPVVYQALTAQRSVEEGLVAWLVGMVAAALGLWLFAQTLQAGPAGAAAERPTAGTGQHSPGGRRRSDTPVR